MVTNRSENRFGQFSPRGRFRHIPFRPTMIPNCVFWIHAGVGITLNGADISDWADQSKDKNHLVQVTEADQPAFTASVAAINGRPAILFTEADGNTMKTAAVVVTQPYEAFAVYNRSSAIDSGNIILAGAGNAVPFFYHNGTKETIKRLTTAKSGDNVATAEWQQRTWLVNDSGNETAMWKNGTNVLAGTTVGAGNLSLISVGNFGTHSAANLYFDGYIAEIIIYDRKLTSVERKQIESYLGDRYAIAITH